MNNKEFLQWIHDRLEFVYHESHNVDFLIRLRDIIKEYDGTEDKTNSVCFNIRPSTDKEIAFKEEIKKKYHLPETNAELIAGRVEIALMEQRKAVLAQCKNWLNETLSDSVSVMDGDKAGHVCKQFFIATFLMAMEGRARIKKMED